MRVRERVLQGYGNRCAWCQRTDLPLELDHVQGGQGQGNAHRAQIKEPLERWLWREFQRTGRWSPDVNVLCQRCHDKKHGRSPMPRSKETVQMNIGLPPSLVTTVETLAQRAEHQGSKSHVVETCIRAYLEDAGSMGALDSVHQQIALLAAEMTKALQATEAALLPQLTALETQVESLRTEVARQGTQLTAFTKQLTSNHTDLQAAFDSLSGRTAAPPKKSRWRR